MIVDRLRSKHLYCKKQIKNLQNCAEMLLERLKVITNISSSTIGSAEPAVPGSMCPYGEMSELPTRRLLLYYACKDHNWRG